jgi:predicted nucleic acid-binding protein
VAAERQLVLGANILIRPVLGRRIRQIITSHAEHASFYAPVVAYDDAAAYLPGLLAKRHLDAAAISAALDFLEALPRIVRPVAEETYESRRAEALSRINARDPDD